MKSIDSQHITLRTLRDSLSDPWGEVSDSAYETGMVVRHWAGRPDRIPQKAGEAGVGALLRSANGDGSWGDPALPAAYRIVPTLGAVLGLLETETTRSLSGWQPGLIARAVSSGVGFLAADPLRITPTALPDLVARDLVVPAALESIIDLMSPERGGTRLPDGHLAVSSESLPSRPGAGDRPALCRSLATWFEQREQLDRLREALRSGVPLPPQVSHFLETTTGPFHGYDVSEYGLGVIGCSAASTAAVLAGSTRPLNSAALFLTAQAARRAGAQPALAPIATFERIWAVSQPVRLGLPLSVALATDYRDLFRSMLDDGVSLGPDMPPDSDLTASACYVLASLGAPVDPATVMSFSGSGPFRTYAAEGVISTTTNAHLAEAIGSWLALHPQDEPRYAGAASAIRDFLLETAHADGSWSDKWHSSPLYATVAVGQALHRYGGGPGRSAVRRALAWVLDAQRADGSWGHWDPTLEETALALHLLLTAHTDFPSVSRVRTAIARGACYLAVHRRFPANHPVRAGRWVGKELFKAPRITDVIVESALWKYAESHLERT